MSKTVFKFRVHTGIFDSDGEQCLIVMGGGLKPDGKDRVWLTKPDGGKLFSVPRTSVEPVDNNEVVSSMVNEREIMRRHQKAPGN